MTGCPCGGTSPADWCDACEAAAQAYQAARWHDAVGESAPWPFIAQRHARRGLGYSLLVYVLAVLAGLWVIERVAGWLAGVLT